VTIRRKPDRNRSQGRLILGFKSQTPQKPHGGLRQEFVHKTGQVVTRRQIDGTRTDLDSVFVSEDQRHPGIHRRGVGQSKTGIHTPLLIDQNSSPGERDYRFDSRLRDQYTVFVSKGEECRSDRELAPGIRMNLSIANRQIALRLDNKGKKNCRQDNRQQWDSIPNQSAETGLSSMILCQGTDYRTGGGSSQTFC